MKRLRPSTALACVCMLLAGGLLCGCSTEPIVRSAITANIVQEQAHNQLLVLNIVRAMQRMPMHFSQVSSVRSGPYGFGFGTPSLGLEWLIGGGMDRAVTFKPSLSSSQNVDVTVQNSQEFMQGITAPVKPSLLLYLLDQGWRPEVVLHLMVNAIEYYGQDDALIRRISNNPSDDLQMKDFKMLVEALRNCEFDSKTISNRTPYTAPAPLARDLGDAAAAKTAGLVPVFARQSVDGHDLYQFDEESKEIAFQLSARPGHAQPPCHVGVSVDPDAKSLTTFALSGSVTIAADRVGISKLLRTYIPGGAASAASRSPPTPPLSASEARTQAAAAAANETPRFVLRSPEAMIYYLGSLARAEAKSGVARRLVFADQSSSLADAPLFSLRSKAPEQVAVQVNYGDATYYVARSLDGSDRSTDTLALLAQVLYLQNKGVTSPATTNVRLLPP